MHTALALLLSLALATAASPALAEDSPNGPQGTEADRAAAADGTSPAQPGTEAAPAATSPAPAGGAGTADTAEETAGDDSGEEDAPSSCAARIKEYQDSLACFGRYRINAVVMDPAAFKNCKTVTEPTDCMAENSN